MNWNKIKLIGGGVLALGAALGYFGFVAPGPDQESAAEVRGMHHETVTLRQGTSSRSYDQLVYDMILDETGDKVPLAIPAVGDAPPAFKKGQKLRLTWRRLGFMGRRLGVSAREQ